MNKHYFIEKILGIQKIHRNKLDYWDPGVHSSCFFSSYQTILNSRKEEI